MIDDIDHHNPTATVDQESAATVDQESAADRSASPTWRTGPLVAGVGLVLFGLLAAIDDGGLATIEWWLAPAAVLLVAAIAVVAVVGRRLRLNPTGAGTMTTGDQ